MGSIAANDLKIRGVALISEQLDKAPEAIIAVRGKERYVVMESSVTGICASASWRPPCWRRGKT